MYLFNNLFIKHLFMLTLTSEGDTNEWSPESKFKDNLLYSSLRKLLHYSLTSDSSSSYDHLGCFVTLTRLHNYNQFTTTIIRVKGKLF